MPEGDTIHRTASTLRRAIEGREVLAWRSALPALGDIEDLVGHRVASVSAKGKHLLVTFDDGRTLHTHMMMKGSWHIYRPGEAWPHGEFRAHAVIETDEWVAVCFDAPVCELLRAGRVPEQVARLGPDLLDPGADLDEAVRRLRGAPDLPVGVAIMTQRLVAGIGNVYKSETLFLCRVSPFVQIDTLDDDALPRIVVEARKLMRQNLPRRSRRTRHRLGRESLWVYGRSGKGCFECGTPIRMKRQGDQGRSTYHCPSCQDVSPRTREPRDS